MYKLLQIMNYYDVLYMAMNLFSQLSIMYRILDAKPGYLCFCNKGFLFLDTCYGLASLIQKKETTIKESLQRF